MDAHLEDAPILSSQTEVTRPTANYHPSVWGDYFLAYGSDSDLTKVDALEEEEHQQLKEEVKKMLMQVPAKSLQKLELIDSIQRLGVDYHFEEEIEASLKYTFDAYEVCIEEDGNDDLYTVALHFRLLRQHGYRVSCHVFDKFKDPEGKFKDSLTSNVAGILALYEAAYFLVHGEDILEEAITFTTSHLELIVPKLTNSMAKQVVEALKLPIQKTWSRLSVKEYISIYEEDHRTQSNYELLLKFAKLDFNILQKMHQRELSGITRWWKGLDFTKKLPFARDRLVECYFWMLGVYFEPQYALARRFLTKVIAMTSVLDDIYDAYGTFDELKLFTDVIESWDISAIDQLPSYMQLFYRALLDVYSESEEELAKEGRSYGIHFAKTEMAKLARAYFEEAKWLYNNYTPTFEEYMKVALVSAGITMLATSSFLGMGEILNKEVFVWVTSEPLMARAISVIGRLEDDMMGHEFEQQRRHVPSAVECYMKQYGTSKQEAFDELHKQVANAWKDVNAECLLPTAVPMPLLVRVVNLVRITNVMYLDDDNYTNSETRLKDFITSTLVTTAATKE